MPSEQLSALLDALRLGRRRNAAALEALRALQLAITRGPGRNAPERRLSRRCFAEVIGNYQASARVFAGLAKTLRLPLRPRARKRRSQPT